MAHGGGHERETLGKFVRNQSGYGTTVTAKKHSQHRSTKFIKHTVCKGDTLMGLSLKYQVTVEVLKRANKLWNNDMLFLRESILIPITPDNEDLLDPESVVTVMERDRSGSNLSNGSHSSTSDKEASVEMPAGKTEDSEQREGDGKKESPLDFLNKYDSSIAKLKSDVAKMKTNAEFIEQIDSHNPLQFIPRKGSTSSQGSRRTISFEDSNPNSPVLVIRSRTQARVVQDSLEKNQRANDDLFEL